MATDKEILGNLLTAYVSNNQVSLDDFKEMIALVTSGASPAAIIAQNPAAVEHAKAATAVPVEEKRPVRQPEKPKRDPKSEQEIAESVGQHHIVSFIDGRPYKTLRRHIGANGMTEMEYKAYYGLPNDYPMVAPSYSQARSQMSKDLGLGRPRKERPLSEGEQRGEERRAQEQAERQAEKDAEEKEREERRARDIAADKARKAKARPNPKPSAKAAPEAKGESEQPDV